MIAALPLVASAVSSVRPVDGLSAAASSATTAASAGSDFTKMLGQMSSDTVDSIKKAESMSVDGLQGSGSNLQQIVQSVMSAQENLQTALAVRDKSVAAFQEVTRMSI